MLPESKTTAGRTGLDALTARPREALVAFDYDGTLAPIVDDPASARPEPSVVAALGELAGRVGTVAIVTGRPAGTAVALGGLAGAAGLDRLVVIGHYGLERWDAADGEVRSIDPHDGVARVRERLPGLLAGLDLGGAEIEDKGLSVAVHTRRLPDPAAAFAALSGPLEELAADTGLVAEPGRMVVELRPPDVHKGKALSALVDEVGARTVAFFGDDLGDLAAFDAVDRLRDEGTPGLLVCSGSVEVATLADRADLVVDGPAGVAEVVRSLVEAIDAAAG